MTTIDIDAAKTAEEAAGLWWAKVVGADAKSDYGDLVGNLLHQSLKSGLPERTLNPDALELFAQHITEAIERAERDYDRRVMLTVDYHPDMLLDGAARQAGLRLTMFDWPAKTVMWVKPDSVTVRYGYSANEEVVWCK